ncbi:MAG TPA: TM2 domain-containing protein [Kofleriaceae bacterium]|nr:TM2 domain-containing protein [Kofleriaceae bacterium]
MELGPDERSSTSTAFLLWLACALGLFGIHRFYLGRTWTGLLYLFTFGLLGVGQLVDLVRLRQLVSDENIRREALLALAEKRALGGRGSQLLLGDRSSPPEQSLEQLRIKLLEAAASRNGQLSVTEGVMATGKPFADVEAELDAMARSGYVGISNDPETGMVVYTFGQLAR